MWQMKRGREHWIENGIDRGYIEPHDHKRSTEIRVGGRLYDFARGSVRSGFEEYEVFDANRKFIGFATSKRAAEVMLKR